MASNGVSKTDTDAPTKGKRNHKRRDGELLSSELRDKVLQSPENTFKKSHIMKLTKLKLCDLAKTLGLIKDNEYEASLARRSEGRKLYLWMVVCASPLRRAVDEYVHWWSEV